MHRIALRIKRLFRGDYPLGPICFRILKKFHLAILFGLFYSKMRIPVPKGSPLIPLILDTYTGTNQTVHPSVLYRDGLYVLAITPYPYGDPFYENPCVYTSKNGIDFVPANTLLPIDVRFGGSANYLSDPAIIFFEGLYHLYYRECAEVTGKLLTTIWKRTSKELISWSAPKKLFHGYDSFICPSAVESRGALTVYYVKISGESTILCRSLETDTGFVDFQELTLCNVPEGMYVWHVDVFHQKGTYLGVFTLATDFDGNGGRLYLSKSIDSGASWDIITEIKFSEDMYNVLPIIYKSAIVNGAVGLDLYISAMTKKYAWHTYVVKNITFDQG